MNHDLRNIETADDDISLFELMEHLKNGWQWLVGGGVVGFVGAFGFVTLAPTQYEATVVIQPATIGMVVATTATTTTTTTSVEPVAQTLERLKLVTFYNDDIVRACGADSAKKLANGVKAGIVKGNSLISLSYRAESAALANTCMTKIVGQLTQSQSAIAAPLIQELREQQASTKQQIEDVERFLAQGDKRAAQRPASNEFSTLMMLKREDLMKLHKLNREQRIQLTEPLTQPMKLLESIYVPEKPVSPKKEMAVAAGLVGGVIAGFLSLLVSRSWRRYQAMSA